MAVNEDVLNEVSTNTPIKKPGAHVNCFDSMIVKEGCGDGIRTAENIKITNHKLSRHQKSSASCSDNIKDLQLIVVEFLKNPIVDKMNEVQDVFLRLYQVFKKNHQIQNIKDLTKRHLLAIIKALELGYLKFAEQAIIDLYNNTNATKLKAFNEVLLTDYSMSNSYYLSTIKIIALQIIIKSQTTHLYDEILVEMFAMDHRYLLKDKRAKIKPLVKLLLNFFTLLPNYKVLLGMKFLQYIPQFNLKFNDFIRNTDPHRFQSQLVYWAKTTRMHIIEYINPYYAQYRLYYTSSGTITPEKIMGEAFPRRIEQLHEVYSEGTLEQLNFVLKELHTISYEEDNQFVGLLNSKKIKSVSDAHKKYVSLILHYATYLEREVILPSDTSLKAFDRITIFINTSLDSISVSDTDLLLKRLANFCLNNADFKRLQNITNLAFNSFVTHRDDSFLLFAANLEHVRLSCTKETNLDFAKVRRFITDSTDSIALSIFEIFFNIYFTFDVTSFSELTTLIQEKLGPCFKNLNAKNYMCFKECSDLMICLLYGTTSICDVPIQEWSPLTRMLFTFLGNRPLIDSACNVAIESSDPLFEYEALIRTAFYLSIEMKNHSCKNLAKITDILIFKWIKNIPKKEEKISRIEGKIVRSLFQYLKFNKFYKKMIQLAKSIQSCPTPYFKSLCLLIRCRELDAYAGLKMITSFTAIYPDVLNEFEALIETGSSWRLDELFEYLSIKLLTIEWEEDHLTFNDLFISKLPKIKPEIFDIKNNSNKPVFLYLRTLAFNIQLLKTSSTLQLYKNNMKEALIEAKKSLKLCQSVFKRQGTFSNEIRLELSSFLNDLFLKVIGIYMRVGVSKDCEFYMSEYLRVLSTIKDPVIMFDSFVFASYYYKYTAQLELSRVALLKANNIFDRLDGSENIDALTKFLFANNEFESLENSLKLFFSGEYESALFSEYWKLKLGQVISNTHNISTFESMNGVNKGQVLFSKVVEQMEIDPFFRNLKESVTAIPSCMYPNTLPESQEPNSVIVTPAKKRIHAFNHVNSPRPSSLTPRSKHLKQRFDKANANNNLTLIKKLVEGFQLDSMENYEIMKASNLYSLAVSMLSSMDLRGIEARTLHEMLALSEIPKCIPLHYDKLFNNLGGEIYDSFTPKKVEFQGTIVNEFKNSLVEMQLSLQEWSNERFNVIAIDICDITGDLLLSKMESATNKHVSLRLPLNRQSSRDIDEDSLTFKDALQELNMIIKESNHSTSSEVTTSIKSKDQRKQWWKTRYDLDKRMSDLMRKIEESWFSGFKSFFNHQIIPSDVMQKFKGRFQEVLQQNLPTRKQFGNPSMFLQVDDFILELFLKLSPSDPCFVEMMEDLIFFVFDILLFHGEENAYDEIDTSLIHVQIEELINDYRNEHSSPQIVTHTFLIVSSCAHIIPWESIGFMREISITRIPCLSSLREMIQNSQGAIAPDVKLNRNLSMILNPQGDLLRTEDNFRDKFETWAECIPGSNLIVGKKPTENTFMEMLRDSSAFIYIGHGGGEQYARMKEIKKCRSIAPSFLLGCSSAYMRNYGHLEPSGVVYAYLMGGCQMVVGNLWDVTDKDIDKFSSAMFSHLAFVENGKRPKRISEAVNLSRDACHLKYLNGAAPVVYGLPLTFSS
ncbi:LAFE_0D05578g1_1 [Lachancea fermentati]|uniref:separase n=1 Tax=Lachancea fermentati TaxID=4955 RepID=A0A1G4MBK2_LACFM|nr:LAFE_0D05578g1_1 [Lachancea fermentati]